jgi:glycosyltransferase involved in cell wall biosynthesis
MVSGTHYNVGVQPSSPDRTLISVVLPVYNGAGYLAEAIQSILDQTYPDFELIIINDGSTDESAAIIRMYDEPRIRYYEQSNQGLPATLNRAVGLANGRYLARQDQDDISFPERFRKQLEFLDAHPDHGIVGTWAEIWVGNTKTKRTHKHHSDDLTLQFDLLFGNPFVHSSVMIRKAALDEVGTYTTDKSRQPPEDYELWSRLAKRFKIANIPEILQIYREVPKSMSRNRVNPMLNRIVAISKENWSWVLEQSSDKKISDVLTLLNGSYQLFSTESGLSELSGLIVKAAERICDLHNVPRNSLKTVAKSYCRILRNRYFSHKYKRSYSLAAGAINSLRRILPR